MTRTIARASDAELIIKKSRFLGCVQPIANRAAAQDVVAALWAQHPDASHVCWALLAGGESAAVDDGEPGGTAGLPMLAVLRKQELDGVLATVVRYFGGVKLGAGGLVRAYTKAVAQALQTAEITAIIEWAGAACLMPYAMEGAARRALEDAGARALQAQHGARVRLQFEAPARALPTLQERLRELSGGQIVWLAP